MTAKAERRSLLVMIVAATLVLSAILGDAFGMAPPIAVFVAVMVWAFTVMGMAFVFTVRTDRR